jgi:hypothetical protein
MNVGGHNNTIRPTRPPLGAPARVLALQDDQIVCECTIPFKFPHGPAAISLGVASNGFLFSFSPLVSWSHYH